MSFFPRLTDHIQLWRGGPPGGGGTPLEFSVSLAAIQAAIGTGGGGGSGNMQLVGVPAGPNAPGLIGYFAQDSNYFYVYTLVGWTRTPISDWS